jgi:hypothetical protein
MLDHLKAKKRPNDLAMRRNSNMERASSQVTSSSTSSIFAAAHTEPAAHAQARGFTQLSTFSTTRRTVSLPSVSRSASICSSRSTTPISWNALLTPVMPELAGLPAVLTEAEKAIQEEEEHQKDLCAVQNALYRWKMEPLIPEDALLDLVQFWDVRMIYHLMFLCQTDMCTRVVKEPIHCCSRWPLMSSLCKRPQSLASECSPPAKRLAPFDETSCLQP